MDVKNTHSVTKMEISVFGRQALDAERWRSPSLADKVLNSNINVFNVLFPVVTVKPLLSMNLEIYLNVFDLTFILHFID